MQLRAVNESATDTHLHPLRGRSTVCGAVLP